MEKYKENYFAKYGCKNILHIGGHLGQESGIYKKLGVDFTFAEPIPKFARAIRKQGDKVIEKAVTRKSGKATFNIGKISERSSLKRTTSSVTPVSKKIEVETVALSAISKGFDGICIDAQGETLDILLGEKDFNFKVIICEVSNEPRYRGEGSARQVTALLQGKGFDLVAQYPHKKLDIHDFVFIKNI